jgi:hypothetical protein
MLSIDFYIMNIEEIHNAKFAPYRNSKKQHERFFQEVLYQYPS